MDLLEQGSAWLEQKRHQFASRQVTYQRGEQSIAVDATIGKTEFELDDGAGALLRVESRDYLIFAADLMLDDDLILPRRGDRIVESEGATSFVYEVTEIAGSPCWRYSDPYRRTLRVHTKQVELLP